MSASPHSTPTASRSALTLQGPRARSRPHDAWYRCSRDVRASARHLARSCRPGRELRTLPCCATWRTARSCCSAKPTRSTKSIAGSCMSQPRCTRCIRTSRSASRCFRAASSSVLDDWVAGKLTTAAFLQAVDWPTVWGYDANLYLPLFHFCRQQRVKMLALNCHRPLVTRVGKEGWAAIPEDERDGLTPSADATPAYRKYLFDIMGGTACADAGDVGRRSGARSFHPRAADLGSRLRLQHRTRAGREPDPPLVIGIIGSGHLQYGHGTPYQLRDLGIENVSVLLPTFDAEHDSRQDRRHRRRDLPARRRRTAGAAAAAHAGGRRCEAASSARDLVMRAKRSIQRARSALKTLRRRDPRFHCALRSWIASLRSQ